MLKNVIWSPERSYRTNGNSEPFEFYLKALCNSNACDLLLGYFSSSAISVLSLGFASFLYRGGTIRIIANDVLSPEDKQAIKDGQERSIHASVLNLADLKSLKNSLNEYGKHFFECLSWLISENRIQIKIIRPKNKQGIAHYKSGIFSDGENTVGFKASCNFTAYGLVENLEQVEIFLDMEDPRSQKFINVQNQYFEDLFQEKSKDVEYLQVDNVKEAIRVEFPSSSIHELLIAEQELLSKKSKLLQGLATQKVIDQTILHLENLANEPRFPFALGPRLYQEEAHQKWVENNYSGIFAMATGTGKTFTALNCLLKDYQESKKYSVIILVPTLVLVEQWVREAQQFNFNNFILVSSKNPQWHKKLTELHSRQSLGISTSYVIIATYKAFASQKFQNLANKLDGDAILIADEVHNLGAKNVRKKLKHFAISKRIGLSATPRRAYDIVGTKAIETFFHDSEPYIFSFSMEKAISEEILCQYYYYPLVVHLQEDEMEEYNIISLRIARLSKRAETDEKTRKQYEKLLVERKRIIHNAKNKFSTFRTIINELNESENRLRYTLVYAPEGYHSDDNLAEEQFPDVQEESRIIDFYSNIIRRVSANTRIAQYTSFSRDRDSLLSNFEQGKIDVLLSMKCLDEGVDLPRTERAIFCSSTGNPRQFIQRRGRILRRHVRKDFASIYDMVVIPKVESNSLNFTTERNLVKNELRRVVNFAYLAINKYKALEKLNDICRYYKINLDTLHNETE